MIFGEKSAKTLDFSKNASKFSTDAARSSTNFDDFFKNYTFPLFEQISVISEDF